MRTAALVRYYLARALSERLLWAWPLMLLAMLVLSWVLAQGMMTEKAEAATAFLAGASRLALVLVIVAHTAIWIARDFDSKEIELLLSRSTGRFGLLAAMLASLVVSALVMALAIIPFVLLLATAPFAGVMLWAATLALEAGLAASLALFISLALPQPVIAISVTLGWYLLSRLSGTLLGTAGIIGIADGELVAAGAGDMAIQEPQSLLDMAMQALLLLLPRLDLLAQGDWLVHAPKITNALFLTTLQCLIQAALVITAALIDFRRRVF